MPPRKQLLLREIELNLGRKNLAKIQIPDYITDNIKYSLFDWQVSGLQHFFAYDDPENELIANPDAPTHLLFNMATGTGKTLMMACLILYYYKKGYRHFIFFVNQNNIVGKTEENLLNPFHSKYLFRDNIVIDDRTVRVEKVDTFSDNTENIQVLFTSIHKLHNSIYTVKENSVYLDDLQKRNLVMLGDEAHHLNADTKKKKGEQLAFEFASQLTATSNESDVERSWENTALRRLLHRDGLSTNEPNENVLLEFTATVPGDVSVEEKYKDKTVFSFDLKDFLQAGFTKEINLVSSSFNKKRRILQALLFCWYRQKIALKYRLSNFKPVVLFRSKLIDDSKRDFDEFKTIIRDLSATDFDFIDQYEDEEFFGKPIYEKGRSRLLDIKHFISDNNIQWSEILDYLRYSFSERNCIITNSKNGTKTKEKTTDEDEKLLNSLEDRNNHIQAIFTVKRLTEGWDVLNLFDIVRLYEGQNEGGRNKKTSEATTSEVQLIGRGIRYWPFQFNDLPIRKRKFDDDLDNELRVLEELYYHSDDNHRYLAQLKNELKHRGYIDERKIIKRFALKNQFVNSPFYKTVSLFVNEQRDNPGRRKLSLDELRKDFEFQVSIQGLHAEETRLELDQDEDTERYATKKEDYQTFSVTINDFERHVVRKAINNKARRDGSMFRFERLKNELRILGINDLFDKKFLGLFAIKIVAPKTYASLADISREEQLTILSAFLTRIEKGLKEISNPFVGSDFFNKKFADIFAGSKEKMVEEDDASKILEKELVGKKWYVLDSFDGTTEEISLVNFLKETMGNLEKQFENVYLLRNEEVYKIFDFQMGRGFQPDFLLFLEKKSKSLFFQVFIEAKGDQFRDATESFLGGKEGWKETFLSDISKKYGHSNLLKIDNKDYSLIGLPMYGETTKAGFRTEYNNELGII